MAKEDILERCAIDPDDSEHRELLENLQAGILAPHGCKHVRLLPLRFTSKDNGRAWVRDFAAQITSAYEHHRERGAVVNLYLSAEGYRQLQLDADRLKGEVNQDPLPANSVRARFMYETHINDVYVNGMRSDYSRQLLTDPPLDSWENAYTESLHGMILLADNNEKVLEGKVAEIKKEGRYVIEIAADETGSALAACGDEGDEKEAGADYVYEHFGYKDGISNPLFYKPQDGAAPSASSKRYDPYKPLKIILTKDPFVKNKAAYGSYLVYRKLQQDVPGFNQAVKQLAEGLKLTANQKNHGVDEAAYAGAMVMGRFKDGTPLVESDVPVTGCGEVSNGFTYDGDPEGLKCPFHAHIRKSNPRAEHEIRERFITRRAIPYGDRDSNSEKGMLFLCFQSDLSSQFNFIQQTWTNDVNFISPRVSKQRWQTGVDPVIGRASEGASVDQHWPKKYDGRETVSFDFKGYVHFKGGEFFFAPSIHFLKNITDISRTALCGVIEG